MSKEEAKIYNQTRSNQIKQDTQYNATGDEWKYDATRNLFRLIKDMQETMTD